MQPHVEPQYPGTALAERLLADAELAQLRAAQLEQLPGVRQQGVAGQVDDGVPPPISESPAVSAAGSWCPVCQHQVEPRRRKFRCLNCGTRGGWWPDGAMYLTDTPATDAGRAARDRLAARHG